MVTRGPVDTHASIGVHIAQQDSTPMILFVGQIARDQAGREAFQEVDYQAMFGSLAKWVVEITDANRIPEIIARAFHTAVSGRPGRSEEHTSELQSLMRISSAVFCLKKITANLNIVISSHKQYTDIHDNNNHTTTQIHHLYILLL